MKTGASRRLRLLAGVALLVLLLAALTAGWVRAQLRASLPQLDGDAALAGLSRPVTAQRDALGVPTLRGDTRADIARALGWLHGQDRFFQMDLWRRNAAGELAELFGPRALPRDRATRMHGFRALARASLDRLAPDRRALLEAYAAGVNAGLAALRERPFEYLILRDTPRPWLPEDSFLVGHAMTLDLQEEEGAYERSLMVLRDRLGPESLAFFAPLLTPDDAALDGTTAPTAPIPGPRVINLRAEKVSLLPHATPAARDTFPFPARDPESAPGSNAFALAGAHTATGSALLANDMHLDFGLPNAWYRAVLEFAGRKIVGVTLPGLPLVVAGSNGRVAWGFTNGYVDSGDLVVVDLNNIAPTLYRVPGREDSIPLEKRRETLRVKGADPVTVDYTWTLWGPIVGADDKNRPLAHRWTMHDPAASDLGLLDLETAATTDEAIAAAHRAGMPAQNILIADSTGAIAWTIAGRLPKRVGYDGRLPVSWTYGDRRWDGFLPPEDVPVIRGADTARPGRLWSANNRHVGGDALAKLGDGAYRAPARAAQMRDTLAALERATPRDLLAAQLDDRALFLAPWHRLLLDTLTPEAIARKPARAALRAAAEKWEGRATVDAVAYRLAREFRGAVRERVFAPIFAACVEDFAAFDWRTLRLEPAFWALWREKPQHLLNPAFARWEDLLEAAADATMTAVGRSGSGLAKATWGERNKVRILHPLARAHAWLSPWLGLPADPLPGDNDMPRVQSPVHGSSERLVVAPGREHEGLFHMPGGQSGHPLSPFFRAGHDAWVRGEPTPLLPGPTTHTLTLRP